MQNYIKLLRIEYLGKTFDIFSDKLHKRTFLEVKEEYGKEVYYYPELKDYIYLDSIYNKEPTEIYKSKNYNFKKGTTYFLKGLFIGILTTIEIITIKELASAGYHFYRDVKYTNVITSDLNDEGYKQKGNVIEVYDNDILTELGIEKVTFAEVRKTLNENQNIEEIYKTQIEEYITLLEERLPKVDLRIFNENLKDLKVEAIKNEDWKEASTVYGYYNSEENKITLRERNTEENQRNFFHELTHTLNVRIGKETNENGTYWLYRNFRMQKNKYGEALNESFTTILTDYLLAVDYETYFEEEERHFPSYQNTCATVYQLWRGYLKDYSFYDYLEGSIKEVEEKLSKYGMEKSIDALDANIEGSSKITPKKEYELQEIEEEILKQIILEKQAEGYSSYDIYKMVGNMLWAPETKYQVCNSLLASGKDWQIRILDNVTENKKDENVTLITPQTNIYQEETLIKAINTFDIFIYKLENEYKLGYLKEDKLVDCITEQEIEMLIGVEPLAKILLDNAGTGVLEHDIEVNLEFLKSKEMKKFMGEEQEVKYSNTK